MTCHLLHPWPTAKWVYPPPAPLRRGTVWHGENGLDNSGIHGTTLGY